MLGVCHFLWDHADAIDLDKDDEKESGTSIKVLFEELARLVAKHGNLIFQDYGGLKWRANRLMELVQIRVAETSFLAEGQEFVEIEDAVRLLENSDSYTEADEECWGEDGLNQIVDDWRGCFGERAR